MQRKITLKTAKKRVGAMPVSRAKIRRIVAEVYATPLDEVIASIPKNFGNIVVTRTSKILNKK